MYGTRSPRVRSPKIKAVPAVDSTETLNFKVTAEFKREFKGYAASQGVSMVNLLKEGFELARRKRAQQ